MEQRLMLHLLQVCNVGQIVGGTAACAWTVTRALPGCRHSVAFLGRPSAETRNVFDGCGILQWDGVTAAAVASVDPDLVLLHNTAGARVELPLPVPTIHYLHSRISPIAADLVLYCSRWLADCCRADSAQVCLQSVPRPPRDSDPTGETRSLREAPVIGRICTPQNRKWPADLVAFYRPLARHFPQVRWEFVGCPASMQQPLFDACGGNACFHEPGWQQRGLLWTWDALLYHNPHVTESFGRTAAEAMRAGCIPIVDRRGGFLEQIPQRCGYLCSDERAFAGAVAELLVAGHRWRLSRVCREHADREFSLQRFQRDLLQRFGEVAARYAAVRRP